MHDEEGNERKKYEKRNTKQERYDQITGPNNAGKLFSRQKLTLAIAITSQNDLE